MVPRTDETLRAAVEAVAHRRVDSERRELMRDGRLPRADVHLLREARRKENTGTLFTVDVEKLEAAGASLRVAHSAPRTACRARTKRSVAGLDEDALLARAPLSHRVALVEA